MASPSLIRRPRNQTLRRRARHQILLRVRPKTLSARCSSILITIWYVSLS